MWTGWRTCSPESCGLWVSRGSPGSGLVHALRGVHLRRVRILYRVCFPPARLCIEREGGMVASSPVGNVPEHLLQTCGAYQHEVALIHRDNPPGDTRETRLAEAMAHGAAVCTSATLEALQRLRTDAPAPHQECLQRLRAWALAMHVRSALLPLQREIQARQRAAVCLVDGEPIPLRASFAAMAAAP